jgi:peptidase E
MKTKFILHGGRIRHQNEGNNAFLREVTKDLNDGDEILFIGFARRDEENRQEVYERDAALIRAQTDKDIIITNATHEDLMEQAKRAKAIFVTGGDSPELVKDIQQYPDFTHAIRGKVYAGSSAGACLVSTYYFGCNPPEVFRGLGWLPIRLLVHYGSEEYNATEEAVAKLERCPDSLELVKIPEYEWVVREINI